MYKIKPLSKSKRASLLAQKGFTLIELLIAIALASILMSVIIFAFNDHKAKGELLLQGTQSLANAAKRMQVETGCYPTNVSVLFNSTYASNASDNTCGTSIANSWSGPYMSIRPVNSDDSMILNSVGPLVRLGFQQLAGPGGSGNTPTIGQAPVNSSQGLQTSGSLPYQYSVVVVGVEPSVARQYMVACLGNSSTSSSTSTKTEGMCLINGQETTAPTAAQAGGKNQLNYVFAESNEPYINTGN